MFPEVKFIFSSVPPLLHENESSPQSLDTTKQEPYLWKSLRNRVQQFADSFSGLQQLKYWKEKRLVFGLF